METKNFKSIHIHNGCRNEKIKIVHNVPKKTFFELVAIGASTHIQDLIDLNLSLMDAESLKASLYGKQYLASFEHAIIKFHISLNDVRIQFNKSFLNVFIKIITKFIIK